MEEKTIRKIDIALIAAALIAISITINYAVPYVISPIDNTNVTINSVLFSFNKSDSVIIDDNPEFSSPEEIHAEDGLAINLKPGIYYLKVREIAMSEIRKLTVLSEINLKLRSAGEAYEVINAGNVGLNVDIYENESYKGTIALKKGEIKNNSGDKFAGRENE